MYLYIIIFIVITLYNNSYKHSIIINRLIKKKMCLFLIQDFFLFFRTGIQKKKMINEKTKSGDVRAQLWGRWKMKGAQFLAEVCKCLFCFIKNYYSFF